MAGSKTEEQDNYAAGAAAQRNLGGRPRKDGTPSQGLGIRPQADEAHLAWDEILELARPMGLGPYDLAMSVSRVEPPGPGGKPVTLQGIDGGSVAQGSEALYNWIRDWHHLPSSLQGAARYRVMFRVKAGGQMIATKELGMPHQAEFAGVGV